MGKKKTGIAGTAIILVIGMFVYFYNSNELYGSDKESIIQVINSIEGYEDKRIEILQIDDFNEVRIVSFLSDDDPSYIEFFKNNKGNYVWKHIEYRKGESLSTFVPLSKESQMMVVTNQHNKVARMQVKVNGTLFKQTFTPSKPSVKWIDYPATEGDGYEFRDYKFFDEDGNLIKSN